jgi:hypothetical protein
VHDRTREQQRIERLLDDAQIKISSVLSDLHGVSGRAMMEALIAGQRDPRALARLAQGRARQKTERLEEALRGQRVKRGELKAVHARTGRRKGLRIQPPPSQKGLF